MAGSLFAAQADRPNILFIHTGDQRFDDLGCYGNPTIQTPHIDQLARGGVRFLNHFVTTAICCCSRASILTGQHMRRHGVQDFTTPLSATQLAETYPAMLRRNGYRTAFLGKYAIASPDRATSPPADQAKTFPLTEKARVQLRGEFYDAFNHTQFSAFDTAARFDGQHRQVNTRLGEMTAARAPRLIQLALRFTF